ncbi:DUF7683 domain-containing protein [Pseudomonas sp. RL_15y_Pfl2_60]|uniref:DUF7683 domain-containing protein n=1 Tax=Pseudomonas sp. RL_15y_Pfl2_60 TaxID=3088709 RepID=UPI0030DA80A4
MKHSILAFDKNSEQLAFRVDIPEGHLEQLAEIMTWQDPEDAIYEYDLSAEQISHLEALTGKAFNDPGYLFQLSCTA